MMANGIPFVHVLKILRGDRDLRSLSKETQISPATLSRLERGGKIDITTLRRLLDHYSGNKKDILLSLGLL